MNYNSFVNYLTHPMDIALKLASIGKYSIDDEKYLRLLFKRKMGYELNLDNPKTFNEKLQWLKLHNKDPRYTTMVDKLQVKDYVAKLLGEEYVIPNYGVWDTFDQIDFSLLPNQFVLKSTHDSGGYVICSDKNTFDVKKARIKLNKSLNRNFFYVGREWPYKDVKPRIIAEKYMTDDDKTDSFTDYKFFCFNGKVDCVMVCMDRRSGDTKFYFFDEKWELKRLNKRGKEAPEGFTVPKPICIEKMFELASTLSNGIPFVRVDLYQSNGKIYFGEMTFFPDSGFDANLLPETDLYFGNLIKQI